MPRVKRATIVAKAAKVFGSRQAAEKWMLKPAMGLGGARPTDLVRSEYGAKLVEQFLGRMQHGVYN